MYTKTLGAITMAACLTMTTVATAQTTYIILKGKGGAAQLKATPESGASSTGSVPVGLVVKSAGGSNVDASGKRWLKVKYGGNVGWVEQSATFKVKGGSDKSTSISSETSVEKAPVVKTEPKLVVNEAAVAKSTKAAINNTSSASVSVTTKPDDQENVFARPTTNTTSVFGAKNKDEIKRSLKAKEDAVAKRKRAEKAKRDKLIENNANQGVKVSNGDTYTVSDTVLYARAEPNQSYTPIMSLSQGQKVNWTGLEAVFSDGSVWWQVDSYGSLGWVPRSGLSGSAAGGIASVSAVRPLTQPTTPQAINNTTYSGQNWAVSGITGGLRLRAGPGTNFQPLASIPSNYRNLIALGDIQGNWLKVQFGNWIGWVSLDYVVPN